MTIALVSALIVLLLVAWVVYDVTQRSHAIIHNFPIIGHFRYWLEMIGPELRQYIVTGDDEERPFSRDQRRWVYASSKRENALFGFGTGNELELSSNYLIVKHAAFPLSTMHQGGAGYDAAARLPAAKILGGYRRRRHAFRPSSIVNVSGMSFGALSGAAVEAMNRGAKLAGCMQATGEGGLSPYHQNSGELIFQIGTGYFSCRDLQGRFDMERLLNIVATNPVRAIEIKLSQGAKPATGGMLPAAKVSPEIAATRGVPPGVDCISPATHQMFHDADSLLDWVEELAEATGLPIGIKSAVGELDFWRELARLMATTERGVDFITIDGGEGGTGAGPLVFGDHVGLPFKLAFSRVYRIFAEAGITDRIVFIGAGKLGFPETALLAIALGCDMVNVGREAMLAVGCIQAQRCHTNHCPTGVATQSRWRASGLDPTLKSVRLANYVIQLRSELISLARACGVPHPALVTTNHIEILDGHFGGASASSVFGYATGWGVPAPADQEQIRGIMAGMRTDEGSPGPS